MLLDPILERFATVTPVCVAVRGVMAAALRADDLDAVFDQTAERQYTRELLFSSCVDVMAGVVCRTHRSVRAAYHASSAGIGVTIRAVYDKLAGIEPGMAAAVVRQTAARLAPVIRRMNGGARPLLPGYRVKILDGNHLARTQRRLKPLRDVAAGPLPGQTLVVLDPELGLAVDVVCSADGHAQERSLLGPLLGTVAVGDVWVVDRNFCTTTFLFGIAGREGSFVARRHASTLSWERESEWHPAGRTGTGRLAEQTVWLVGPDGTERAVRRVRLTLDRPTQDGDAEIEILTNLPAAVADAARVAELYRGRWRIEGLFQAMTCLLKCEVNTLGYPPAALFGFCVALAASNVLATVKAALRGVHGAEPVDQKVSDYYLADELAGTYRGMMVVLPPESWAWCGIADVETLAGWLLDLARRVRLDRYPKQPRGPKKPKPRRTRFARKKHIATARLLAGTQKQ